MNEIEFWQLQKTAELSNTEVAKHLEVGTRTIERWRAGKPSAPRAAILALQAYIKDNQHEIRNQSGNG